LDCLDGADGLPIRCGRFSGPSSCHTKRNRRIEDRQKFADGSQDGTQAVGLGIDLRCGVTKVLTRGKVLRNSRCSLGARTSIGRCIHDDLPGFDQTWVIREFEELSDRRSRCGMPSPRFGTTDYGFYEEDSETE